MGALAIHYELHLRRRAADDWALDHAGEDRAAMLAAAEAMLASRGAVAVRVVKEVFDAQSGRFSSVNVLEKGEAAPRRAAVKRKVDAALPCTSAADLHTAHARERIGRLLEGFLRRHRITPWELLHRPDLAESLEASGSDIQGAVQRIAVAEAQARGASTHDMVRAFQRLADDGLERLIRDGRRKAFPELDVGSFAEAAGRMAEAPDGLRLLSGGVAACLAGLPWFAKLERLADLLEAAPVAGRARGLAERALEPPLTEMLAGGAPLEVVLDDAPDLGGRLAVLMRLAGHAEMQALAKVAPDSLRGLPDAQGAAARLGPLLAGPAFEPLRRALAAHVLRELEGPRRLRPGDPEGEIEILRALAAVLTASGTRLVAHEDLQAAFVARSRQLVAHDFVTLFTADRGGALAEARALVRLCENVTGVINKRQGGRWLLGVLQSLRFETEVRGWAETPGARLAALATLQRAVLAAALPEPESAAAVKRLGEAGGWIEAEAGVVAAIVRSAAPPVTRATVLVHLAAGETAPLGPVADRAREEALRLLRQPQVRSELVARPDAESLLRTLAASAAA